MTLSEFLTSQGIKPPAYADQWAEQNNYSVAGGADPFLANEEGRVRPGQEGGYQNLVNSIQGQAPMIWKNGMSYVPMYGNGPADIDTPQVRKILGGEFKAPDFIQDENGQWLQSTDVKKKLSDALGIGKDKGLFDNPIFPLILAAVGGGMAGLYGGAGTGLEAGSSLYGGGLATELGAGTAEGLAGITAQGAAGGSSILDRLRSLFPNLSDATHSTNLPEAWGVNPQSGNPFADAFANDPGGMDAFMQQLGQQSGAAAGPGGWIDSSLAKLALTGGLGGLSGGDGAGGWGTDETIPQSPDEMPGGGSLSSTAASLAAKTALGRLLSGEGSVDDYLKALGALGSTGLGILGANQQTNALKDVTNQFLNLGAPYRDRLNASYAPGFDLNNEPGYRSAIDTSSQGVLRNLSAKVGNPYDTSGAVSEAEKYVTGNVALPQLNTYRSQLGGFGGLGVNTAGTAALGGAQASGGALNSIGYGLSSLLSPEDDITKLLKQLGGTSGLKLNLGSGF